MRYGLAPLAELARAVGGAPARLGRADRARAHAAEIAPVVRGAERAARARARGARARAPLHRRRGARAAHAARRAQGPRAERRARGLPTAEREASLERMLHGLERTRAPRRADARLQPRRRARRTPRAGAGAAAPAACRGDRRGPAARAGARARRCTSLRDRGAEPSPCAASATSCSASSPTCSTTRCATAPPGGRVDVALQPRRRRRSPRRRRRGPRHPGRAARARVRELLPHSGRRRRRAAAWASPS